MQNLFNELLDEYRRQGLHFLNIKTRHRELFFVLDDSYYLTYRDETKEIVFSLPLKPKPNSGAKLIYQYNTNNRPLDDWYDDAVCAEYAIMNDRDKYFEPDFRDIEISYMNEEQKVPLKKFLALLPRTNYKVLGNMIFFERIGSDVKRVERAYHTEERSINPIIRYWLNSDEIKPSIYELVNAVEALTINVDDIEEITGRPTNARFVFDDGSIRMLRDILESK